VFDPIIGEVEPPAARVGLGGLPLRRYQQRKRIRREESQNPFHESAERLELSADVHFDDAVRPARQGFGGAFQQPEQYNDGGFQPRGSERPRRRARRLQQEKGPQDNRQRLPGAAFGIEVNGAAVTGVVKVNKSGKVIKVKGLPATLGLTAGANRVRVIRDGLFSNILILTR